ncbi:methyltransferase domain-containing protein [Hyphomonas sp.]|uniref:methyltransferase domain-containing protein n=1 Tax=Hyphomonas sp. TaxID=87 RepID=UPI003F6E5945|tara:strand:- start:14548 stop:15507 length:960 start_codon:yes stop_codon:yes gene_type:complete
MANIEGALKDRWYYTVELDKGRYTNGFSFKNIAPTRRVLEGVDVKGRSLLDISTMEGMFSILMSRRGGQVMATDSLDSTSRINLLKSVYGCRFDYIPNMPVKNFAEQMIALQASKSFVPDRPLTPTEVTPYGFDVVLSSGLIYHVLNPIDHLVTYRQLCKLGGLCIIESAVLLSDDIEMVHDWRGDSKAFGGNATWFVSTRALEVFLKACFFEPLAYAWVESSNYGDRKLARLAVVARAVEERPFSSDEHDIIKGSELYKNYDFKPLYPSAQIVGKVAQPVQINTENLLTASNMRGSAILNTKPMDIPEKYLTLSLDDA